MEPLAALSVAASVVQFVQFGCSLVSKSGEIHSSAKGGTTRNIELEATTNRLIQLSEWMVKSSQVQQQSPSVVSPESQLQAIYDDCRSVSRELITSLEKLKVQSNQKHKRWKSFRQALKSVWSKKEIDALAERLLSHKNALDTYALASLSERFHNLSILQDQSFKTLDKTLQQSIETLLRKLHATHKDMETVLALHKNSVAHISERAKHEGVAVPKELIELAQRSKQLDAMVDGNLLGSLRFPDMYHRREEVSEAHRKTLSWIFKCPAEEDRPWSDFSQWLREDNGMYWINGKAGSGKSTLMKYVYDSEETSQQLKIWSRNEQLLVASYFFWNSGSLEQRSQSGLFRSLLFEILQQDRSLTRKIFQEPWTEYRNMIGPIDSNWEKDKVEEERKSWSWKWNFKTLQHALSRLVKIGGFKLCLFIDGLDECDGEHEDLAEYFRIMSSLPNVKICVSSRPWIVFEQVFEECKGLRVQDLTCLDIQCYVKDKLFGNSLMQRLTRAEPVATSEFQKTLTRKANGVFLWVTLAVKSLLKGLRNQDGIADLQKRLEALPSDLNSLYSLMLDRIEPIYVEQASRIFQLYDCSSTQNLRISALELDLAVTADFDTAMVSHRIPMSSEEITIRSERITTHLKSRCEGLLEVHDLIDRRWDSFEEPPNAYANTLENDEDSLDRGTERQRTKVDLKVSYLHRTVKDFLKTNTVRAKLRHDTASVVDFDPNLSLLISYIMNLKFLVCSFYYDSSGMSWDDRLWSTIRDSLLFAGSIRIKHDLARNKLLRELYNLGCHWWQHKTLSLDPAFLNPNPYRRSSEWRSEFLSWAVYYGLASYVGSELQRDDSISCGPEGTPLLAYALGIHSPRPGLPSQLITPQLVETLLKYGANPNARCSSSPTIFEHFLQSMHSLGVCDTTTLIRYAHILKSMLRYRGYIYATCPSQCRRLNPKLVNHSVVDVVVDTLATSVPEEAAELYEILEKKRSDHERRNEPSNRKRKREIVFIDLTD